MQRSPTVGNIGETLRDVTKFVTKEPLPAEFVSLLILMELVEERQAITSHSLPHWTSRREPKKS